MGQANQDLNRMLEQALRSIENLQRDFQGLKS